MNFYYCQRLYLCRVLIITTVILLGGCVPYTASLVDSPFNCPTVNEDPKNSNSGIPSPTPSQPISQPLNIEIHIDGSGSMLGYVPDKSPTETTYSKILGFLNNVFVDTGDPALPGSQPSLQFFRTGLNKTQNILREEFKFKVPGQLDPRFKPFYQDNVTSELQSAIVAPDKQHDRLIVIVSDLDQDNSDITKVKRLIQEYYLRSGKLGSYSIAVLGVLSPFQGKVYSTDPAQVKDFEYPNNSSNSTDRPFYLLWLGPNDRLPTYLKKFTNKLEQFNVQYKLSIFSTHALTQGFALSPVNLDSSPSPSPSVSPFPDGIDPTTDLNIPGLVLSQNNAAANLFWINSKVIDKPTTVKYTLPAQGTQESQAFSNFKDAIVDVEKLKVNRSSLWTFIPDTQTFESTTSIAPPLSLNNINYVNNQLSFQLAIDPNKLENNQIYPQRFDVMVDDLKDQDWWKDWDWNNRANDQDGSKTYQILRFMESLQDLTIDTFEKEKKTIGTMCFAVQKR